MATALIDGNSSGKSEPVKIVSSYILSFLSLVCSPSSLDMLMYYIVSLPLFYF